MKKQHSRRRVLQGAAAACAALLLPGKEEAVEAGLRVAGQDVEIQIAPVSEHTARLTIFPLKHLREDGQVMPVTGDGSLVQTSWGPPLATLRSLSSPRSVKTGNLKVGVYSDPIVFKISSAKGLALLQLKVDRETGVVSFTTGNAPLLGLGEGGPQFDRRGSTDRIVSGQGGYRLRTHGGRVPIPWIIGTHRRSKNVSRKEIALRHAHLSGNRFLPLRMEYRKRFLHLELPRVSRSQGNHR